MGKVHRLDELDANFLADARVLISTPSHSGREKLLEMCQKYGISQEAVYYRIRSYYGKPLKQLRDEYFTPSRDALLYLVRSSASLDELWERLPMPVRYRAGLFARVLGVSTFSQAKQLAELEAAAPTYRPSRADNEALLVSQVVGDGSVDRRRRALKIEHGWKQRSWLEAKVKMLAEAFPYVGTSIRQRVQQLNGKPYRSYSWYSGKLRGVDHLLLPPKHTLYRYLTPIGVWALFLDDGSYTRSRHQHVVTFAVENNDEAEGLIAHLETYGYSFHPSGRTIQLSRSSDAIRFIKEFGEQFRHLTPPEMQYKVSVKV